MKTIAVLLTALLGTTALSAVHADSVEGCVSECRTRLLQASEQDCSSYRSELPRPDLYNHCQHGHMEGREAACKLLCQGGGAPKHARQLDSRRLDACAQFQGRPPSERVSSCNAGYVKARSRALAMTKDRPLTQNNEPVKPAAPAAPKEPVQEVKKADDAEVKRKLSLNSQTSAKSVLEAAREEAAAAFQEAKATEL